jgi:hypothetical protein
MRSDFSVRSKSDDPVPVTGTCGEGAEAVVIGDVPVGRGGSSRGFHMSVDLLV